MQIIAKMAELRREYVIPLRRRTRTAPKWRRSKKAVSVLKDFIRKHMKTDNIVICSELNETIWERGIKNPPSKLSIVAVKGDFGGSERTLVNLLEVGVEKQIELYSVMKQQAGSSAQVKDADVKEQVKKGDKVKDAEADEIDDVSDVKEEVKVEETAEVKKQDAEETKKPTGKKKEVKKDE